MGVEGEGVGRREWVGVAGSSSGGVDLDWFWPEKKRKKKLKFSKIFSD